MHHLQHQASVLPERRAPSVASSRRVVTLIDAHFPSGRAQVLAWDVVLQGQQDLSTWLCRSTNGAYFLLCRTLMQPSMPAAIVPLSPARAVAWYDAHPAHIADRDVLQ